MNLGIFLSSGESLSLMKQTGQDVRFVKYYLKNYAKNFEKVYVFSYLNESPRLPSNVILVPNKTKLHRLIYAIFLPLICRKEIKKCDVIRGFGLASSLSSFLLIKPFIFNWAYDYISFAKLEKKFLYIPFYFILEKLAFLKAKKIFIATKAKFAKLAGEKFIYLPNGVDTKLFRPTTLHKKGLIFVGRFEKQKNLFFLIDAISILPVKFRSVTFIGIGPQEKALKKYAIKKNVALKIMAPVTHLKLPQLLSRFSIFTFPSLAEGSPKVLLEAMALGLVPVVTNFSTAKEVVESGNNGYITTYNVDDYSQRLKSLLSNEELTKKISKRAVQLIAKNFSLEHLITNEIKALKEIAK